MKEKTFYIEGMHCASCEVLIEKRLLKKQGVKSVDASLSSNSVTVNYLGDNLKANALSNEFEDLGYKFSNEPIKKEKTRLITYKDGKLKIQKQFFSVLAVFLGVLLLFYIVDSFELGRYASVDTTSSLSAFFILGIVAGFSSCAALIGGLLLSLMKQWHSTAGSNKKRPHILFHAGRIGAFFLLGGVLGSLGDIFLSYDSQMFYIIMVLLVSAIMFVLALQMLEVSWAQKFRFALPKKLGRYISDEQNFSGKYMPAAVGALTFFLPCGFTLIAQGVALVSASFIKGALIMGFFSLGTLPLLAGISMTGLQMNKKPHLSNLFNKIAGTIILFFVLYNVNGQLNVLGLPSFSDFRNKFAAVRQVDDSFYNKADTIKEQEIHMTANGFNYMLTSDQVIHAGVPTTLVVDNKGVQGCGAFIASRGLINNYVPLQLGLNKIDVGIPAEGTYKITCAMGMVSPVTIYAK